MLISFEMKEVRRIEYFDKRRRNARELYIFR